MFNSLIFPHLRGGLYRLADRIIRHK